MSDDVTDHESSYSGRTDRVNVLIHELFGDEPSVTCCIRRILKCKGALQIIRTVQPARKLKMSFEISITELEVFKDRFHK